MSVSGWGVCMCVCMRRRFSISAPNVLTSWHSLPPHSYTDRWPPKSHAAEHEGGKWRHNQSGPCTVTRGSSTGAAASDGASACRQTPCTLHPASHPWKGQYMINRPIQTGNLLHCVHNALLITVLYIGHSRVLNITSVQSWGSAVLRGFTYFLPQHN